MFAATRSFAFGLRYASLSPRSDTKSRTQSPDGFARRTAEPGRGASQLFAALGDGGQVQMPLGKTFWSPAFGMVADRFGVSWMVNVAA